jgi:hypothetical protein
MRDYSERLTVSEIDDLAAWDASWQKEVRHDDETDLRPHDSQRRLYRRVRRLPGCICRSGAPVRLSPFAQGLPSQGYQLPMTPAELIRAGIDAADGAASRLVDRDQAGRHRLIQELSDGSANLGAVNIEAFFAELWLLTNQGYFADPVYDGNKGYAVWQMVGFSGARAYCTDFVTRNASYPAPPMGISHVPGQGPVRISVKRRIIPAGLGLPDG